MKGIECGSRTLRLHYIPETCGFTVCTGGKEFATVTGAEPWILFRDGRRLFFREASECTVQLYPCGVGEGILATFSVFPFGSLPENWRIGRNKRFAERG